MYNVYFFSPIEKNSFVWEKKFQITQSKWNIYFHTGDNIATQSIVIINQLKYNSFWICKLFLFVNIYFHFICPAVLLDEEPILWLSFICKFVCDLTYVVPC